MPKAHILYIEDNPDNRILVSRVLQADGYSVTLANDGPSGLVAARQRRPDLVLMDINLPEVDGYAMTELFRATPGLNVIPIVALTANVMKGDRERSLAAGCNGYIQKPIDVDTLPNQIAEYLARTPSA
ncbi:MAG TPA: response regulator [Anaerolineales bacterium]|nr:response regulator [Anaerolineales bacterium]HRF48043.1 response regulator [Anaerolineales bacterium]